LYFPVSVALAHEVKLVPLAVLVARKDFTVYHAHRQAVVAAKGPSGGFLLVQAGIVFLGVCGNSAINIDDSWLLHGILLSVALCLGHLAEFLIYPDSCGLEYKTIKDGQCNTALVELVLLRLLNLDCPVTIARRFLHRLQLPLD